MALTRCGAGASRPGKRAVGHKLLQVAHTVENFIFKLDVEQLVLKIMDDVC
jgi:hypothetical protein